jgi:hypothetical protein
MFAFTYADLLQGFLTLYGHLLGVAQTDLHFDQFIGFVCC